MEIPRVQVYVALSLDGFLVRAVEMMSRIALEVEGRIEFKNYPAPEASETHALTEAIRTIEGVLKPKCIVVMTASGYTAARVASERPCSPVFAVTRQPHVYHMLNLVWGLTPVLIDGQADTFEELTTLAESAMRERGCVQAGDTILVLGGIPARKARGTNFIKLHTVA